LTVVTIDLGTSVCKIQAFDYEGTQLCSYSQEVETAHPRPDWAEQDPESWWKDVVSGVRSCGQNLQGPGECRAICVCSHRESIVPVDRRGKVLAPCMLWADRRCEAEAAELAREFGGEIHQRTGMKSDPYFTAPKLLWLKRNRPELIPRIHRFLLPKDYIVHRLTGEWFTDWTVASRTMMLDLKRMDWWPEMLEYVGADGEKMCTPRDSSCVVGEMTKDIGKQLGLSGRPLVVAGAGDRQCEAMGSGVSAERAMESTGSATNVSVSSNRLPNRLHQGLLYSCHSVPGTFLVEQGIGSTGFALRWFRDSFHPPVADEIFRSDPYGYIDRVASGSPPGANGLIFLPFLSGAQATRWNPAARGMIFGLTLGHTYGDLARAILEGIAYEIRACIGVLSREGMNPGVVLALGGASRSSVWNQIKANVTQRIYSRPRVPAAASLGAFMLACSGLGVEAATAEGLNPVEAQWTPDPSASPIYDEMFSRYEKLYDATAPGSGSRA